MMPRCRHPRWRRRSIAGSMALAWSRSSPGTLRAACGTLVRWPARLQVGMLGTGALQPPCLCLSCQNTRRRGARTTLSLQHPLAFHGLYAFSHPASTSPGCQAHPAVACAPLVRFNTLRCIPTVTSSRPLCIGGGGVFPLRPRRLVLRVVGLGSFPPNARRLRVGLFCGGVLSPQR